MYLLTALTYVSAFTLAHMQAPSDRQTTSQALGLFLAYALLCAVGCAAAAALLPMFRHLQVRDGLD